jgi:hypothetical protein
LLKLINPFLALMLVVMPRVPAGADAGDPAVRLRSSEYAQRVMKQICDAALMP